MLRKVREMEIQLKEVARIAHTYLNDGRGRQLIVLGSAHGLRKIIVTKLSRVSRAYRQLATSNLVFQISALFAWQ